MSAQPTLYQIQPGPQNGQLSVESVWTEDGTGPLASGYSQLFPLPVKDSLYLIGVGGDKKATAFSVQSRAPWIVPTASQLDLGGPWDIIEPFVIGNIPHLMAYASKNGKFSFFPITDELKSEPPYNFARNHEPGVTAGFDVAYPFTIFGMVYYLCYSFATGKVAIYSLSMTASSPQGTPPLVSKYVWIHQWARNWTRFAFFQLGGENFFFKINVGPKPNVNIDHIQDDPTQGTVEVGSYLHLENSSKIDIARPFYLGGGDPYFITYMKDGTTTFNRFRGDCQGWTTEASLNTVKDATQIVPLQVGDQCFVLFC
jgi:hypothetical protein